MPRPFFAPIRSTFTRKKGAELSDNDLLRIWGHLTPAEIRRQPLAGRSAASNERTRAIRERAARLVERRDAERRATNRDERTA